MKNIVSFLSGVLFALGLGISGMTRPDIVRGFLDFFGTWNWRLMGVMVGAILVHRISFKLITRRESPVLETEFHLPNKTDIDGRLILGSVLFGLGWGWAGICPGPGLVSLTSGKEAFLYFVGSMIVSMKLFQVLENKFFALK